MSNSKNHVIVSLCLIIVATVILLAMGLFYNPYGFFDWESVGSHKALFVKSAVSKLRRVQSGDMKTVVLGNSRVVNGFSRDAFATQESPFNAAFPGASYKELDLVANYVIDRGNVGRIVLVIDPDVLFEDGVRTGFVELGFTNHKNWLVRKLDTIFLHVSLPALSNGAFTAMFRKGELAIASEAKDSQDGFRPAQEGNSVTPPGGVYSGSQKVEKQLEGNGGKFSQQVLRRNLLRLENTLISACRNGIKVDIVLPPVHAHMREVWARRLDTKSIYEWIRDLVEAVDAAQRSCGQQMQYGLFSCLAYNPLTEEQIPGMGDQHTRMQYYFETSHFRMILGDACLAYVLSSGDGQLDVDAVSLDVNNVAEYISTLDWQRRVYLRDGYQAFH